MLALTGGEDFSHDDGWFIAPPMSSEETPPTPSPPSGEDSARSIPSASFQEGTGVPP